MPSSAASDTTPAAESIETVPCNLCGSLNCPEIFRMPDTLFWKDEWFSVVECPECGLGFVNPRPTQEGIGRYYPAEYYKWFKKEEAFNRNRYRVEAEFVHRFSNASGERLLLDVGCANGDFPRYMKTLEWNVEGVEISKESDAIHDFTVYKQPFPGIPVHGPRYDVVTAWAVLEHVHDPAAYFKKAAEVLKPGGVFIFNIPNFDSITCRALYREDVPRHLYFFSEKSIRQYLSRNGMELRHAAIDDSVYVIQPHNWLHYLWRFKRKGKHFTYQDSLFSRAAYLQERGLKPGLMNSLRFFAANPHIILDRLFRRAFERYQIRHRSYGMVTYVAEKPAAS